MNANSSIKSRQNEVFRKLKSLLTTAGIRESGNFLVFGKKILSDQIDNRQIEQLITTTAFDNELLLNRKLKRPPIFLSEELFKEIDIFGTHFPLGIANYKPWTAWNGTLPANELTVFLALQDPTNVGTAVRNCAAFNVNTVVLLSECAHPFHPRALRASSGANLSLNFLQGPSIVDLSHNHGHSKLFALDGKGTTTVAGFAWPDDGFGLLIGEEGRGVPDTFTGQRISIPINPKIESLNAAAALAIVLYEIRRLRM